MQASRDDRCFFARCVWNGVPTITYVPSVQHQTSNYLQNAMLKRTFQMHQIMYVTSVWNLEVTIDI
eukprot:2099225-Amphidinium_carterae.1